jgi:predicted ATP-grasp superfamily ATP-dependent carboligase
LAVARDAHEHGIEPVVVDLGEGVAHQSRWVHAEVLAEQSPADTTLRHVLSLSRPSGAALVATSDAWLRWLMGERAALERAFTVLHPSNESLHLCLNKWAFVAWCAGHDLSTPRFWHVGAQDRPSGLQSPFLLRPVQTLHGGTLGSTGIPKAVEAKDEQELQDWLGRFAQARCDVLVTESLLGRPLIQYSVPFARARGHTISFVARKIRPSPQRCAVGTLVELSPEPGVETLALQAAEALDYFGVGEAEILKDISTGRSYLVEINARPWLQYALAPASGHDFLGLLLQVNDARRRPVKLGRCWIDLRSDLFGAFSRSVGEVRHGNLGALEYLASLLRVNVCARFSWRDPAPALWRPARHSRRAVVA